MEHIHIRMLGEFSLQAGEYKISDSDNRTRKVWRLLAYLICQRGRAVSQKRLMELLWGDEPTSTNPENALRITFHRMRTMLNRLWPTAGRDLIVRREGGYAWNEQQSVSVDYERFDKLCSAKCADEEQRLKDCLEALELYRGDFLEKQSSETWVIPLSTHYHNLYITAVLDAAQLLADRDRHEEAARICRSAVPAEPYHEPLHQMLIRELAAIGDQKGAAAVYETLSSRLFDDFGIHPNDETRAVYREAVHAPSDMVLPMDVVMEHLQEPEKISGAMYCDYDHFKVLCYAESRSVEHTGDDTHIALLSLSAESERFLTKRGRERIMSQLGEQIRANTRRIDTYSRCSGSQYILMLPQVNYENSCMVAREVIGAFHRAHPHVMARVNYMVQHLTPGICVPEGRF